MPVHTSHASSSPHFVSFRLHSPSAKLGILHDAEQVAERVLTRSLRDETLMRILRTTT